MSRVPIRVRLTAGFAALITLVLALAGVFIYLLVRSDLDQTIDRGLRSRTDDLASLVAESDTGLAQGASGRLAESEESFAQVLLLDGTVLDSTPGATSPALSADEITNLDSSLIVDRRTVSGIEGQARLLASPISAQGLRLIVVVGTSIADRDEALDGLVRAFALGGPIVVLLVSAAGYLLASLGLAPVEAMRRQADTVTLGGGDRLELPAANDEIRRLGETLNAMLARLEDSFQRERAFVADASHELRTPLAVLKAELEVTLRGDGYDKPVGAALEIAIDEADHLTRLAEDLLLTARAEDGGLAVQMVDVGELLGAVAERFRNRSVQDNRRIEVSAPSDLEWPVDPIRLRQAVVNLVDNALRHGRGTVSLAAVRSAGLLILTVADEGPGFPTGFASRAFERFSRADHSRARGGAGLGLAIVQAIARAHGGEAIIVSSATGGSEVALHLPLDPPDSGGGPAA